MGLLKGLKKVVHKIEQMVDFTKAGVKNRFGTHDPLMVHPYLSFGTTTKLFLKGRVLEDKGIIHADANDSLFRNLRRMIKRVESDEIPKTTLLISFNGQEWTTVSDEEGYYTLPVELENPAKPDQWHQVAVEAVKVPKNYVPGYKSYHEVLIPETIDFGIISDIDDTIIETGATSLFKMARNTFFYNVKTRSPLKGASKFYRQLHDGPKGESKNPFFYISSSPWSLYDFLIEFLKLNEFPLGPLFLKDYGITPKALLTRGHQAHKMNAIKNLMQVYPKMKFILIGDSGQKDALIYKEAALKFPGRILAIYIHDVKIKKKTKHVKEISESLKDKHEVPLILLNDTDAAVIDAKERGFIP